MPPPWLPVEIKRDRQTRSMHVPKSKNLVHWYVFILPAAHLYAMDVGATHAAAAIDEEQQFSGGFVQLQRFTQQVGAEVEHQDGAAQNVFVVSLPHKLQLHELGHM